MRFRCRVSPIDVPDGLPSATAAPTGKTDGGPGLTAAPSADYPAAVVEVVMSEDTSESASSADSTEDIYAPDLVAVIEVPPKTSETPPSTPASTASGRLPIGAAAPVRDPRSPRYPGDPRQEAREGRARAWVGLTLGVPCYMEVVKEKR